MKKFGVILYSLLCILLLGACKEDEYVYPNVITTFINAATDESGTLQKLITDKGESLQILNREGLDGLTPDSIYRSVSIYEPKESADEGQATALLYSCQLIIAVKPVTVDKLPEATAKTDPLDIQSVWKSGNYINLILLPMAKEKSHIFHFIDEGISNNGDGSRTLHLTLYHNQNGDYEAFTRKSYLSIPLWAYEGQLTQGDKVVLRINTYEKGFVSYELLTKTTSMIKTIYFMFFICMFAVAMVACKGKSNDDFKNVSADEFEGFIGNEQIQIVDVRTVAEYSEGHIPGSLNINVLDESFSANADELLNPEQTIAVYCKSGRRSRNAAKILVKKGFKVYNLDKGFDNWKELGKEIEQ